jgi:hypothetical protein
MLEPKVFLASEIAFKTIDALSTLVQDSLLFQLVFRQRARVLSLQRFALEFFPPNWWC